MAGSFTQEKSACLVEVSVTEQILRKFPKFLEILGELSMRKQCVLGSFFFSLPTHESLGIRLKYKDISTLLSMVPQIGLPMYNNFLMDIIKRNELMLPKNQHPSSKDMRYPHSNFPRIT